VATYVCSTVDVAEVSELHAWEGRVGWPYSCNRKEVWGTLDILSSAFLGEERGHHLRLRLLKILKQFFVKRYSLGDECFFLNLQNLISTFAYVLKVS